MKIFKILTVLRKYFFSVSTNNMIIDYNKNRKLIFTLKDWKINFYDDKLNFIKKINLNYNFPNFREISYFKFNELENCFQIVCADNDKVYSFEFYVNENLIFQKVLSENQKKTILQLNNHNNLDVIFKDDYSYEAKCLVYSKKDEFFEINLHDEFDKQFDLQEKDWDYEYVESIVNTNQENQFSLISVHANYGVQGVKIFQINSSKELDLIYDMDDLDFEGAFHNLAFSPNGKNFIVLLYERRKNFTDYFSICNYSLENNKKPTKICKTDYGYWTFGDLHTHYLNEIILGIVRSTDIIIFDLDNEKTIEVLERDLNSDYFIDYNILIYQLNKKLMIKNF